MRTAWRRATVFGTLAVSAVLLSPQDLRAESIASEGCLIRSTPFYKKLLGAGVFEPQEGRPADKRPMALLFKVAKAFHYRSDKQRYDRWQTADETTKTYSGDCEDKAIWLYTQLRRNGYRDASLHIGKYGPTSRKFHMWVTFNDRDGRTLLLDPTMQKKPWPIDAFPDKNYRSAHMITGEDCVSVIGLD